MEPFLSQVYMFSFNWAPQNFALCNGALLPITSNQALFALIGTLYGGDGTSNFALPDLRGRVPCHTGNGISEGLKGGVETVTLGISQMPEHTHQVSAVSGQGTLTESGANGTWAIADSGTSAFSSYNVYDKNNVTSILPLQVSDVGASQAHNNMQPSLAINYCIATAGAFPSRN